MDDTTFIKICQDSQSMAKACAEIGIHFNTFKKRALKLGCYIPNQGLKNSSKPRPESMKIDLHEILEGKHPHYQTFKLKNKLYAAGMKTNCCEICGIDSWNDLPIQCELDHIDGNSKNHKLENLRILCPNCHSQTETFRAKNIK